MLRSLYNWYYRLTVKMQAPDSLTLEATLKETKIKYLKMLDEEEDYELHQQIAAISADHYAKRMERIEIQLEKIYARENAKQSQTKLGPMVSYADA